MITGDLRNWLSIGTGIGVEIRGGDLVVTVVRVRPKEIRVVAGTTIARFRDRAANEWGAEYNEFLRKAGVGHLTATVLLPREEIIVRQLTLPGVGGKDLEAALRYQVDGLHPYPEGEATYGWARIPNSQVVLIGIARADLIERYSVLLAEAGVRTAAFTFSAAVAHAAIRMHSTPPSEGFLVLEPLGDELEAYGESPARPVFSATFDLPAERIVPLATSELRLEPDLEPISLLDLLPVSESTPGDWDLKHAVLSYATALAGACPWLALSVNLLPAERRSRSSRAVYAPTVALAALLLIALSALGAYGGMQDRDYVAAVESEIARFSTDAGKISDLEANTRRIHARRELVREFLARTQKDMDALLELTRLLDPPTWLRNLTMNQRQVMITGEAPEAGRLLGLVDDSGLFRNSEYTSPISDAGEMQNFSIRVAREDGQPGESQ